jgi:hypothetical protein
LGGGVMLELAYIPPGKFWMGGTQAEWEEIEWQCNKYGWQAN